MGEVGEVCKVKGLGDEDKVDEVRGVDGGGAGHRLTTPALNNHLRRGGSRKGPISFVFLYFLKIKGLPLKYNLF